MLHSKTTSLTAALVVAAMSMPAAAQVSVGAGISGNGGGASVGADASADANGNASGKASNAGARASGNASSSAEASTDANFGRIVSAIRTGNGLDGAADITSIDVVDVESEINGSNEAALENAIEDNEATIADLRTAIESNAELSAMLDSEDVDIDTVVAIATRADGTLTVFTR